MKWVNLYYKLVRSPKRTPHSGHGSWNYVCVLSSGQMCNESKEEFDRRMTRKCAHCGRTGHMFCWARVGPGESVEAGVDFQEERS